MTAGLPKELKKEIEDYLRLTKVRPIITPDYVLTEDDVFWLSDLIKEYGTTAVVANLIRSLGKDFPFIITGAHCSMCGREENITLSKTKFCAALSSGWDYVCPICKRRQEDEAEKKRREEAKKFRQQLKKQQEEATQFFTETYLNPDSNWTIPLEKAFYRLSQVYDQTDKDKIAKYIRSMDYDDFLETPYWKAISYHKKRQAGFRCQLCNSDGYLVTHHRDYKRAYGWEIENLSELIVLCDSCHETHHLYN